MQSASNVGSGVGFGGGAAAPGHSSVKGNYLVSNWVIAVARLDSLFRFGPLNHPRTRPPNHGITHPSATLHAQEVGSAVADCDGGAGLSAEEAERAAALEQVQVGKRTRVRFMAGGQGQGCDPRDQRKRDGPAAPPCRAAKDTWRQTAAGGKENADTRATFLRRLCRGLHRG